MGFRDLLSVFSSSLFFRIFFFVCVSIHRVFHIRHHLSGGRDLLQLVGGVHCTHIPLSVSRLLCPRFYLFIYLFEQMVQRMSVFWCVLFLFLFRSVHLHRRLSISIHLSTLFFRGLCHSLTHSRTRLECCLYVYGNLFRYFSSFPMSMSSAPFLRFLLLFLWLHNKGFQFVVFVFVLSMLLLVCGETMTRTTTRAKERPVVCVVCVI